VDRHFLDGVQRITASFENAGFPCLPQSLDDHSDILRLIINEYNASLGHQISLPFREKWSALLLERAETGVVNVRSNMRAC
jgi:hypothetical protein